MTLNHTTGTEDAILTTANEAGGIAAEAAGIAERIDAELSKATDKIEELENDLMQAKESMQ